MDWIFARLSFNDSVTLFSVFDTRLSCVMVATSLGIDGTFRTGGRIGKRIKDVVDSEHATDKLLQFAAVVGSVENRLACGTEFGHGLTAFRQHLPLFGVIGVRSDRTRRAQHRDDGHDSKPTRTRMPLFRFIHHAFTPKSHVRFIAVCHPYCKARFETNRSNRALLLSAQYEYGAKHHRVTSPFGHGEFEFVHVGL